MKRLLEALGPLGRARLERWLIAGGILAALLLLLGEWIRVAPEPLGPDARVFRELAQSDLHSLYDTSFREPLHVWLVALVLRFFGDGDLALRGLSVFLYASALAIYYATTRALFGRGFAAVVFFLFALSRKNAALAVEGLRNFEVVIALVLTALATRRALEKKASARSEALGEALVGLASGLGALAYLTLFLVTQSWIWSAHALERVRSRWLALALVIPLLLVLPHLLNNRRETGHLLDSLDRHARFYRNLEYENRPGMPTTAERERDPYAGPRVTGLGYVLEGRTPLEIAKISGLGLVRWASVRAPSYEAYRTETFAHFGIPIWAATLAGGSLILLRKRRFLWIPALVLCCGIPFVFLLGIHQLDGRLLNDYLFAWLWLLRGLVPSDENLARLP